MGEIFLFLYEKLISENVLRMDDDLLKGQCLAILDNFILRKKIRLGPQMNRQNVFREVFSFREDIQLQSLKISCPRSHWLRGHYNFIFR